MANIRIDADAKSAIAEILAFTRAQEGIGKGQDEIAKKNKEAAAEERRLASLRKQLLNESLTGVEKAQKKLEDFENAIKSQSIEEQKAGRIRQRLNAELQAALDEQSGKTAQLAQAEANRQKELKETAEEAAKAAAAQARLLAEEEAAQAKLAATREKYFNQYESQSEKAKKKIREFNASIAGQKVNEEQVAAVRKKLNAEYLAALDKEKAAVEDVGEQVKGAGDASEKSFGSAAVKKLGAFAAGAITISAGVGLVKKELAAIQDIIDKSVTAQITVDQSRAVLRRNLGGASNEDIKKVQEAATSISDSTGVSESFINAGLASAISASGGNIEASIKAVKTAAKFSPDSPGDIGTVAGALLDLAKATGTDDANVNLGFLSAIGVQGRVVDLNQQAQNLSPGVIGTLAFGGNYRESGAALAALTNASADFSGASSSTAVIQLANQLEAFDKGNDTFDGKTIGGRIAALQQNPELAQKFLADASFEQKSVGVIRQLLTDSTSTAAKEYQNSLAAIGSVDELRERGKRSVEVLDIENNAAATARRERAIVRAAEAAATERPEESLSSTEIEALKNLAQRRGASRSAVDAVAILESLDGDGVTPEEAASGFRSQAELLRRGTATQAGFIPASENSLQSADALIKVAELLEAQIAETKKQTAAIQEEKRGTPLQ